MTGPEQDDLRPRRGLGPGGIEIGGQPRLGGPQVEPRQRPEGVAQRDGVGRHEGGQFVEDALDLVAFGGLRLAPGIAELDGNQRLHEQRLAATRRIMEDALDAAPGLGPDRHDVAAVAQRHDRFLEAARRRFGLDQGLEAPPQPVVGDPDGGPQPTQPWRGAVEQLADRIERPGEHAA